MPLTDKEKQEVRNGFINELMSRGITILNRDGNGVSNFVADYFLSIIEQKVKEKLESVENIKKIHEMELDAISLKSLEEFMVWSDNRKLITKAKGE